MLYTVRIEEKTLQYTIRRYKQSKHIRISIGRGNEVLVTGPRYVSMRTLHAYVVTKADWIFGHISQKSTLLYDDLYQTDRAHFVMHKSAAYAVALKKVMQWSAFYQFPYTKISVKQLKSRWGSCSSLRKLNFSYRIVFLPEELQDYLVVHELCHLKEMNHSKHFWQLVEQALPNYKELRNKLKNI